MTATKLLAGFLAALAVSTVALPAAAGPQAGSATFYDHINYGGSSYFVTGDWGSCVNLPTYHDDVVSSVALNGAFRFILYYDDNCGTELTRGYQSEPNLGVFSDQAQSVRVYG